MENQTNDFDAFWLDYVREHSHPLNRQLHMIGISLGLACLAAGIFKRRVSLLLLAPVVGYGFSWCGHFLVEKNTPKSFSHPWLSLKAGALLYWKTICGEMDAEVERAREVQGRAEPRREETASAEVN